MDVYRKIKYRNKYRKINVSFVAWGFSEYLIFERSYDLIFIAFVYISKYLLIIIYVLIIKAYYIFITTALRLQCCIIIYVNTLCFHHIYTFIL